jgi:hypothetical protein
MSAKSFKARYRLDLPLPLAPVTCDGNASIANAPAVITTFTAGYLTGGSQGSYYRGSAQSYNLAKPTGFSSTPNTTYGLYSIEVK